MGRSYLRFVTIAITGSALAALVIRLASRYLRDRVFPWHALITYLPIAVAIIAVGAGLRWLLARQEDRLHWAAEAQAVFLLEELPERWVGTAIVAAAALSLFLELAVIRWQATVFPFLSYYKNLSLLSCFVGLGLGYSMGRQGRVPLFLTAPLLCWQFLFMITMRYGVSSTQFQGLSALPVSEQLNMGLLKVAHFYDGLPTFYVLAVIFLLTALAFMPIGQLCGCLMERREELTAYGLNLLGSLAGVLLMFLVSAFWTPPTLWFLIAFAILLSFYVRKRIVFATGAAFVAMALLILEWPVRPSWQRIYSPYQLLEVGHSEHGLIVIRAAGYYYQKALDFSSNGDSMLANSELRNAKEYYDLPYHLVNQPRDVAVVGAGTGNDVAAALRGGAERVDAIEIDPAILMLGQAAHPERPYSNPRVRGIVNDARSFLRTTDHHYDVIVFGLLDSHTLLSQASSVRLDSFVYTEEAMREARARLKPHGIISLAFSVLNDQLGRKIYLMLEKAFDGHPPLCIQVGYDGGVVFLESADQRLTLPQNLLDQKGFLDRSATYRNPALHANVSTDDWPFFYMPERVYPVSYLLVVLLVLVLSLFLFSSFLPMSLHSRNLPFGLLGAGFMLVETKGITEMGLTFGNSWQVIGLVIAGIMVMAFLANWSVKHFAIKRSIVPYGLLLASLAVGWWVSKSGGLPSTWTGRIGTGVLLTLPLFFSGMVFSTLLRTRGDVSGAMSANLFGAMCGGLLEYNSMYFGFRFLYLMAAGLYVLALVSEVAGAKLEGSAAWGPQTTIALRSR